MISTYLQKTCGNPISLPNGSKGLPKGLDLVGGRPSPLKNARFEPPISGAKSHPSCGCAVRPT